MTVRPNCVAPLAFIACTFIAAGAYAQTVSRVYEYRIADGHTRIVADSLHMHALPQWSPTGSAFSVFDNDSAKPEIRIYAASGQLRRRTLLPQPQGNGGEWSPDERWVVYRGLLGAVTRQLIVVSTTSDSARLLAPLPPLGHWAMTWSQDSRSVLMMRRPEVAGDSSTTIERVDLDGNVQVLYRAQDLSGPINDSLLYEKRGRAYFVRNYAHAEKEYRLISVDSGYISSPAFSRDRNWVAFRLNPAGNNSAMTVLEIMRIDGSGRTQIKLPFNAAPNEDNPQFLPGSTELIVTEDGRFTDTPGMYLVSVTTGAVKKLATVSRASRQQPQVSVSPDGTRVLFWRTDEVGRN